MKISKFNTSIKNATLKNSKTLILLIFSIAAGFFGGYAAVKSTQPVNSLMNASNETKQQIVSTEEEVFSSIAKDVGESVVSIDVTGVTQTTNFFGYTNNIQQQAAGTGVIVSDSVIVTNKHVVPAGTSSVTVTLADGTVLDASVLARDPRNDVAFIKISDTKGKTLKPARFGDSSQIQVGQKVLAIGNALGQFQNTVTSGIISGYGRSITAGDNGGSEDLTNLIQTDAAINEGNSGGPLVDLSGEVIGINTAITSSSTGQSLGFSIPINDIKSQISSVLQKGIIERPYLGVRYRQIDDRFAYVYNLPVKSGAYLPPSQDGQSSVISGSPAEKAGLKEKDIITKIDDQQIDDKNDVVSVLGKYQVGDTITLTVMRDGKEIKISVTLGTTPAQ
ncbi:trypsin-like peptidase domain-containing protein [Candidatus Saccharibacteria bacterium]|nr:trypsin-like peptidase domain-containing protein [Candidatus Saccharibacteria bacterium]